MKYLLVFTALFVLSLSLSAQDQIAVNKDALEKGVSIELSVSDLSNDQAYLRIADVAGQAIALKELWLDDRQIWLKRSDDEATLNGSANWMDDETSRTIDLRGISDLLNSTQQLRCTIVLLDSKEDAYSLTVAQVDSREQIPAELIRTIDIDLN